MRAAIITRVLCLLGLLGGGWIHAAEDHFRSPDGRFEAYRISRNADQTGARLFLRTAGSKEPGVLLRENDRWIDCKWSPDSKFMALIDGLDGHVTDIFVYRVAKPKNGSQDPTQVRSMSFGSIGQVAESVMAPEIDVCMWYHTPAPGTYDSQWSLKSWMSDGGLQLVNQNPKGSDPVTVKLSGPVIQPYRFHHAETTGLCNEVVGPDGRKTTVVFSRDSDEDSLAVLDALLEKGIYGQEKPGTLHGATYIQHIRLFGEFSSGIKKTPENPHGAVAEPYREFRLVHLEIVFPISLVKTSPEGNPIEGPFVMETHFGPESLFPEGVTRGKEKEKVDLSRHSLKAPD